MNLQKRMQVITFVVSLMVASCETTADKLSMIAGQWYGQIIRISDGKTIGQSVLAFEDGRLKITSTALYTPSLNQLNFTEFKEDVYYFENDTTILNLQMTLRNDTLTAEGAGFKIISIRDSLRASSLVENYKEREIPIAVGSYIFGNWRGELYRSSDDKLLSKIVMNSTLDSLWIYSNAISGKNNISWKLSKYYSSHDIFEYQSSNLTWRLMPVKEGVVVEGEGCYALLTPAEELNTGFFKNKVAQSNPNLYLAGNKYQGEIILHGSASILSAFTKLYREIEFLDDERLRMTTKIVVTDNNMALLSTLGGASPEQEDTEYLNYSISNNTLYCKKTKYEIRENGNVLLTNSDEGRIKLQKGANIIPAERNRSFNYRTCEHCDGSGMQMKFSSEYQRRMMGDCSYCQGKGKRYVYE